MTQLRVEQGALSVRVNRFDANDQFEIDTPNLAFALRQPGEYRISADPNNDYTAVIVRRGSAEAYGENAAYTIANGQSYAFTARACSLRATACRPRPTHSIPGAMRRTSATRARSRRAMSRPK
jgi:hypothetical protein